MRRHAVRGLAAGLLTVALTLLPAAPQFATASGLPGATTSCSGVWVVVEIGPGDRTVRCGTDTRNGFTVLESAGFNLTKDGYLCAIEGYPKDCQKAWGKARYWSYWKAKLKADGTWGSWSYATTGPKDSRPSAGYAEGWRFVESTAVAPSVKPPKQYTKAARPTISGTAKVGKTLKVKTGSWFPKPGFSYRWYRSGTAISGATKAGYKLTKADKGKRITVKVTGKRGGWETLSKTSKQTAKVKK
ncbi:MAG: hypothetical protein KIT69_01690 [Propionibacteriaceae bacterium]|nr:hypothetical protein [Propionibacteriaceae bacterium]